MPDVYLEPRDLSPEQVQRVLDFLNRATSAQQLNRDIEFPGEPDIGVKLGQRLLDARAALGGQFSAIAQVRAVRLIGPERFTEICVAALGLAPERWVELFYGASPMAPQAETGLVVTLEARPQPAWLGVPLGVTVRVADRGGTPRAAIAVTVQAGAGRLVWMYGYTRIEGEAVTVVTGADGSAELELVRPPSEPLSDIQQAALEHELSSLDVNAGDPIKLEADFRALGKVYLSERSYNLRRAIDIHVRDRRDATLAAINPGAWRLAWPVDSVLLQADAHGVVEGAGSGVLGGAAVARAVLAVQWKNWVGAWLEFFGDLLREQGGLDAGFARAVARGRADLLPDVMGQAQRFVASQGGRAALWLGQKEITGAVARVMGGELEGASPETQAAVLTQLEAAAREVNPTTLGSFTLVSKARRDLGGALANLGEVNLARLAQAEALLANIDQKAAQLNTAVARFNTDYARFNSDLASFDNTRLTLNTRLDGLQTNVSTLQLNLAQIQAPRSGPPAPAAASAAPRKRAPRKRGGA